MAIQFGTNTRNARLDAIETVLGTTAILTIRVGAAPANCAAADTAGAVLATINLPSDWMAAATGGTKSIAGGPWQDTTADAGGLAGHFRIKTGATCELQGTVGQGTGDLSLDNATIVAGQTVQVTGFTLTDANP